MKKIHRCYFSYTKGLIRIVYTIIENISVSMEHLCTFINALTFRMVFFGMAGLTIISHPYLLLLCPFLFCLFLFSTRSSLFIPPPTQGTAVAGETEQKSRLSLLGGGRHSHSDLSPLNWSVYASLVSMAVQLNSVK